MYADNTKICFNLEDFPAYNREISINKELCKVNVWLKLNILTLNVEKTKCMYFRKKRNTENISLYIDNKSIDAVSHSNYLGLVICHGKTT